MKVNYDVEKFVGDFNLYVKIHGLTYKEVAEALNMSPSTVWRVATGKTIRPTVDFINKLAIFMGKTTADYVLSENCYIIDPNVIDIHKLSIEEIDAMIERLRAVRNEKLDEEWAKLNAAQERLLKLKSMEE